MAEKIMCRTCGQPLPPQSREGVWLPPMKAKIFDFIDRYPGVTPDGVLAHCFPNGRTKVNVVRQHIYQINSLLAATNTRITGKAKDAKGCYYVIRAKRTDAC